MVDFQFLFLMIVLVLAIGHVANKKYETVKVRGLCTRCGHGKSSYYATFVFEVESEGKVERITAEVSEMSIVSPVEGREYKLLVKKANPLKISVYRNWMLQLIACTVFFSFFIIAGFAARLMGP